MEAARACAHLQLHFVDQCHWRDELIRPVGLFEERPATQQALTQRAHDTATHPATVRQCTRRFEPQGLLGLLPEAVEIVPKGTAPRVPPEVIEEMGRLNALYDGFPSQELVRMVLCQLGDRMTDKTAKKLWPQSPPAPQGALPLGDSHRYPDRSEARLAVMKLSSQGWTKLSISHFLPVSRPTVDRGIRRVEDEPFAGLVGRPRGPQAPRKVGFPVMVAIEHLQKAHPDAGEFRIWSLLANDESAVRTGGRVMALNRPGYAAIPLPHGAKGPKKPAQPHPYKAPSPQAFWCIDGRKMDVACDGVKWWSVRILDGSSRTMLAGALAPTEASWVTLLVLSPACRRSGAPQHVLSDSGGACTSNAVKAVFKRLAIPPKPLGSTHGEREKNLLETHCTIPRRLSDDQLAHTTTPAELEQVHQTVMATYHTPAQQG